MSEILLPLQMICTKAILHLQKILKISNVSEYKTRPVWLGTTATPCLPDDNECRQFCTGCRCKLHRVDFMSRLGRADSAEPTRPYAAEHDIFAGFSRLRPKLSEKICNRWPIKKQEQTCQQFTINYWPLAFNMTESRLGLGWKAALLLCWCEDGRIRADNALLTHSPSTPPIRTNEFVIADLRIFNLVDG